MLLYGGDGFDELRTVVPKFWKSEMMGVPVLRTSVQGSSHPPCLSLSVDYTVHALMESSSSSYHL